MALTVTIAVKDLRGSIAATHTRKQTLPPTRPRAEARSADTHGHSERISLPPHVFLFRK